MATEHDATGKTPGGTLARLDLRALAQVGASRVLALAEEAWLSLVLIRGSEPATKLLAAKTVTVPAPDDDEPDDDEGALVALVEVFGPLAQRAQATLCGYVDGYDAVAARFAAAVADPRVGAVVLVVDSPGGDVAGAEEAFASMRGARDRAGKPVYAYAGEMAASAAYWMSATIASAGVYLPRSGAVGSVGVIAAHVDESAALEAEGLKVTLVRDPAGKAAGHSAEPLGDLARKRLEAVVEATADRFMSAIAEARGLTPKAVRATDAGMFWGAEAVSAGFADGVASLAEVVNKAAIAAQTRRNEMGMRQALAALVKAPDSATDEQLEIGARAALPLLDLGRAALTLTGAKSADDAAGVLASWQGAASKLAAREVEEAEARKARDKADRVAAVVALVASGRVTPAEAKIDATGALADGNIAEPWGAMDLGVLRSMASRLAPRAETKKPAEAKADPEPGAEALSPDELRVAKTLKIDPKAFAARKAAEAKARAAELAKEIAS